MGVNIARFLALMVVAVIWSPSRGAGQFRALSGAPVLSIGTLDNPAEQVFGEIVDVAVGPSGDIFILDAQALELRWFGPDGSYRGTAGRQGEGPGEFAVLFALAVDGLGLVHVLDPRNGRISVFDPTDSGLQLVDETSVPFARDLCVVGDRRYLLMYATLGDGKVIHEIDGEGNSIHAFASPIEPEPELLRRFPRQNWGGSEIVSGMGHSDAMQLRARSFSCRRTSPSCAPTHSTVRSCGR